MVGDDQPFSLWLAAGVPFEVVESASKDGSNFVSDFDARELAARPGKAQGKFACRNSATIHPPQAEMMRETLTDLFAFKNRIRDQLRAVPYIAEDEPAVCAWYPTARKILVWNLSEQSRTLTVVFGRQGRSLRLEPLAATLTDV